MSQKADLRIDIITPSSYDDNSKLKQYSRVLMMPPALAVLSGLAEDIALDFARNLRLM